MLSVWCVNNYCTSNALAVLAILINLRGQKIAADISPIFRRYFELSMYFKVSHKNKSVHKRIAHSLELFSNHMFILGRMNRVEKAVKHHHQ